MEKAFIEEYENAYGEIEYGVYDSTGHLIEDDFETEMSAMVWANENGYDTDH